jgi:signal transduction histidine kinase
VRVDFEMARFARRLELTLQDETAPDFRARLDLRRVRQAIGELIQNAVKATADGGAVRVRFHLDEARETPRFCVAVADTGIGIPEGEQARVFEMFYGLGDERHHHSSKFAFMGAGAGMGLSIAREIALAHGGEVELASRPQQGAVFTFWVPCPPVGAAT